MSWYRRYININAKTLASLLLFPILLGIILEVVSHKGSFSIIPNFFENLLSAIIVFLLINQIIVYRFGKQIALFLIVSFYTIIFFETGLYLLFQTRFNASYIYVILNTNLNEVSEFSSVYYKNNLIWLVLFFIPLFRFFPKKIALNQDIKPKYVWFNVLPILLILGFLKFSALIVWNLPYVSVKSYLQYQAQIASLEEFNSRKKEISTELTLDNETMVIVIGESTTSKHLGIYGYHRKTTPRLSKLKDSLIVYKDVISSEVYTTGSLFDVLTLKNTESKNQAYTLIDYLKNSGFKTFWLSNQRPVGFHDNLTSRLASAADETVFLSYNDYRHNTLYDEVLLPKLEEKLLVEGKKVIFLHIIGTHYDYANRYPSNFENFKLENKKRKDYIINSYDNAVLYNDFIVSEVIKRVKKQGGRSAVLYFSDHGDEVFDDSDFFGHFQDKPTPAMYEIPFMLYLTPDYNKPIDFESRPNRVFMLDDFPHSLTHLLGIKSKLLESQRSIFSQSFSERKRLINDGVDYDKEFKLQFSSNDQK